VAITAADASNAALAYRATGLPAGLSINRDTGLVTGTPTRGGTYTVVVQATDTSGRAGTTSFRWTVRFASVLSISAPVSRCKVTGGHRVCTYTAGRSQNVTARSGQPARGTLHLVTASGGAIAGAPITIVDGKRTSTVRTGHSGIASFVLAKGPNRSIRAAYAGGSKFTPAGLTFHVRNTG
jgi:hypothetical protein